MLIGAEKTPQSFGRAKLLSVDFDSTIARTFEPNAKGIGVTEAYDLAVESVFGAKALGIYFATGGLRNRAAPEVTKQLAPDATAEEQEQLTAQLITDKLSVLTGEIGSALPGGGRWPRPTDGYLELVSAVAKANDEGQLVDIGVISSGHDPFIRQVHQMWGAPNPDYIIAEEATRDLARGIPIEMMVKPSPLLMDALYAQWAADYGVKELRTLLYNHDCGRIMYVGDDPVNDGTLAKNSGVEFVHLIPDKSAEIWQRVARRLLIGRYTVQGVVQHAR